MALGEKFQYIIVVSIFLTLAAETLMLLNQRTITQNQEQLVMEFENLNSTLTQILNIVSY